mmetsp:Transcript_2238/g.3522  ORF Transcript_2238/g.3522 Transcript_2238/m.3522 type:complete len:240 (-) Transcript_2238:1428-2147(-)
MQRIGPVLAATAVVVVPALLGWCSCVTSLWYTFPSSTCNWRIFSVLSPPLLAAVAVPSTSRTEITIGMMPVTPPTISDCIGIALAASAVPVKTLSAESGSKVRYGACWATSCRTRVIQRSVNSFTSAGGSALYFSITVTPRLQRRCAPKFNQGRSPSPRKVFSCAMLGGMSCGVKYARRPGGTTMLPPVKCCSISPAILLGSVTAPLKGGPVKNLDPVTSVMQSSSWVYRAMCFSSQRS